MVITDGSSTDFTKFTDLNFYATSRLLETKTFQEGTYDCSYINIRNQSECDILFDRMDLNDEVWYTNVLMDRDADYVSSFRTETDNGVAAALKNYLQETMNFYNRNPEHITDEDTMAELEFLQERFADDPDFTDQGYTLRYYPDQLGDPAYLQKLLRACNKLTAVRLTQMYKGGCQIPAGGTKQFTVVSWVEHDLLYGEDAGQELVSHKTPTELIGDGQREDVTKRFSVTAHFVQAD